MACQGCKSERVGHVSAKCADMFSMNLPPGPGWRGYVADDVGIGSGEYIRFFYCLDCGQIQGTFPVPPAEFEAKPAEEAQASK